MQMKNVLTWTAVIIIITALIIIPFLLLGESVEAWVKALIEHSRGNPIPASLILGSLLAGDIILPTPSSILSTGCGTLLGFIPGMIVSATGMQICSLFGYILGMRAARPMLKRWIDEKNTESLESLTSRYGLWTILITRPIPVLAEAATIFAGMGRIPFLPYMMISAVANIGISALYAWVGSNSHSATSLLLAFAAAVLLPGMAMLVRYIFRKKTTPNRLRKVNP